MDPLEAVRIKALLAVMEGDSFSYLYRRITRTYAKLFSTPLHEVEELPIEYVLEHYFEHVYEELTPAQRKKLAIELTETDAERKARLRREKKRGDDAFVKRIAKEAAKAEAEAEAREKAVVEQAKKKVEKAGEEDMLGKPPPPDFSVRFDSNLPDEDMLAPRPQPPRK